MSRPTDASDETAVLILAAGVARALSEADPQVRLHFLRSIDAAYNDMQDALGDGADADTFAALTRMRARIRAGDSPSIREILERAARRPN